LGQTCCIFAAEASAAKIYRFHDLKTLYKIAFPAGKANNSRQRESNFGKYGFAALFQKC
jgi:hypothetical protein